MVKQAVERGAENEIMRILQILSMCLHNIIEEEASISRGDYSKIFLEDPKAVLWSFILG